MLSTIEIIITIIIVIIIIIIIIISLHNGILNFYRILNFYY